MRDIMPDEMAKREFVFGKIKGVLARYGFQMAEPSTLESLDTLVAKSGPAIENEVYAFEDKSIRKIGLRFDLTVGLARMVANNDWPRPIRLACISNMWRYDNPQYARYRNFWQWDAEIYGCSGVAADAEIIALMCDILSEFGLDYEIRISNRKLIEGFLLGNGVKRDSLIDVLRIIDKASKISEKELTTELEKYMNKDKAKGIPKMLKEGFSGIKASLPKNDLAQQGLKELEELFSLLKAYKKDGKCRLDISVVRGIDYYTSIVYEAWVKSETDVGAIAGGGRYDDLLGLYGKPMPATGVAGGIERLLISLEKQKLLPEPDKKVVMIIYVNESVFEKAIEITQKLRESGITAFMDLAKRNMARQLEYANKSGVPLAVIVGPKELAVGKAKLRNMASGVEKEVGLNELANTLLKTAL